MFLSDLFESETRQIVVVYPGRFQPFHKGHKAVYDHLTQKFGYDNVFIATSDKVDPPRSPFNFQEKLAMMKLTGINPAKVVQSTQPYIAKEIVQQLNPSNTVILFAVSEKDMKEDPRFRFAPKKDGSPSYFQPAPEDLTQAETLDKHGYIYVAPTVEFTVLGKPMIRATDIRADFAAADEQTKKAIIKDLFGNYNDTVYNLMSSKILAESNEDVDPKYASLTKQAQLKFPHATSPQEALALYILDQQEREVDRLDHVNKIEDNLIAKLQDLDVLLQAKIDDLQRQIFDLQGK